MKRTGKLDYKSAGVDIRAADSIVKGFGRLARSSQKKHLKKIVPAPGGYASLYALDRNQMIAASTDGVGTKLKLAFELDHHESVGVDLVAMSVNDLLCVGAQPLFFLDYFATGKLKPKTARAVMKGIVKGCKEAGVALVGGETAEMPGLYSKGEYDLAGFAVGMVNRRQLLQPRSIKSGDVLIGLASSGFHSNGFSLLRKLLDREPKRNRARLAKKLLTPTKIYTAAIQPLIEERLLKAAVHITGGGFSNLARLFADASSVRPLAFDVELPLRGRAEVFDWISVKDVTFFEQVRTFNLGIGMILVVDQKNSSKVLQRLKRARYKSWVIGQVVRLQALGASATKNKRVQVCLGSQTVLI